MARICFYTLIASIMLIFGCVERQLTIKTVPAGGIVTLNDEEIGQAPVTVAFQWYGDYNIQVAKPGYETLKTHRKLDRPWYDLFPFDFFADVLWPGNITSRYEWSFELKEYTEPSREKLIDEARNFRKEAGID